LRAIQPSLLFTAQVVHDFPELFEGGFEVFDGHGCFQ
jgi:hypothetical protein